MKVVWTSEAVDSFDEIYEFVLQQWNLNIAKAFATLVDEKIAEISISPNAYPIFDLDRNIRRILVHPHVTLFYKCFTSEQIIHVLLFWDNRKNPVERVL